MRKVCVFFQFLIDKIHSYVKQNIIKNFIIQILKNEHTFLKKYTNLAKLSSLDLCHQNIIVNFIIQKLRN